jgi:hypothetical protein
MAGMNWDELNAEERLLAEQAVMNRRALRKACREAEDGKVLAVAEQLAMEQGREFIRRMLESSLQEEGREVEKKVVPSGRVRAD